MRADFEVAVGAGHAGASLAFERAPEDPVRANRWLVAAVSLLTLPFTVVLAVNAIGYQFSGRGIHALPVHLGQVLTLGPPLALLLYIVARFRLHGGRLEGRWVGRLSARLNGWELALGLLALAVAVMFFGHLVADSLACANGVKSAC